MMLNQPKRINRFLMDMSQQRFLLDLFFSSTDAGNAGAIVYDQQTANELYPTRDVQRIEPGGTYPNILAEELTPGVAVVEKWGGKFPVTDEARKRNNGTGLRNRIIKLGNGLVRKMNQRAISALDASIAATSQTYSSDNNWGTIVTAGTSASSAEEYPAADIATVQMMAEVDELGVELDTLAVNPAQAASMRILYGSSGLREMLADMNITTFMSSNRVAAGTAYMAAKGQVGEVAIEQPLTTKTYRDEDHDRDFVKSSVILVPYVTNPYAVFKLTSLAS
jgi:hypothetical protein